MHNLIEAGTQAFAAATIKAKIGFGFSGELPHPFAAQRRPPYNLFYDPFRVIKITDETDKIIAVIVNYQAHPTQLPQENSDISAEYPGAIVRALYNKIPDLQFGSYFNGAIGDVSPIGHREYSRAMLQGKSKFAAMEEALNSLQKMGNEIIDCVLQTLDSIEVEPISNVVVHRRFLFPEVFREKPFWNRLKRYKTLKGKLFLIWREFRTKMRIGFLTYGYWFFNTRPLPMLNIRKNGMKLVHQTELYVFKINDIVWFSAPGEPFSLYQQQLFEMVPEKKAFFNCMANDTCGYIFPWDFYVKGGYELTFSFDMLFGEYLLHTFKQELKKILQE
jgi:hypothetical protein